MPPPPPPPPPMPEYQSILVCLLGCPLQCRSTNLLWSVYYVVPSNAGVSIYSGPSIRLPHTVPEYQFILVRLLYCPLQCRSTIYSGPSIRLPPNAGVPIYCGSSIRLNGKVSFRNKQWSNVVNICCSFKHIWPI